MPLVPTTDEGVQCFVVFDNTPYTQSRRQLMLEHSSSDVQVCARQAAHGHLVFEYRWKSIVTSAEGHVPTQKFILQNRIRSKGPA